MTNAPALPFTMPLPPVTTRLPEICTPRLASKVASPLTVKSAPRTVSALLPVPTVLEPAKPPQKRISSLRL